MISSDMLIMQQQMYNFLRSMSIKYSPIAEYLNNTLIANGYTVSSDQTTWKYYLNMVGEYHASDTQMYVVSLDTRQTILFSVANLEINPRTREAYMPGGQYYSRLCQIYPSQVDLIKSILFPVSSITTAIDADDFTLLGYGDGYLEEWEQPLIVMEIEKFLKIYSERWYFSFLDDEPYFYLTSWGWLWQCLAMVIMSARMEFIQTPYVHSWHIWNKLEANGVSNYSDLLNREQSMMLYQNIDYLKQNAGKKSNLIILADNLLKDFGIGLYGRIVVQESLTGASSYELNPLLTATKIPTSYGSLAVQIPAETVSTVQTQLYSLGLTASEDATTVTEIERELSDTTLNYYPTKFLEIRPIAKNTPYAQAMSNFYFETLILCINEGYYTNAVQFVEPITNTILYLTPSELVAMLNYAIQQSIGISNDTIPTKFILKESFTTTIGTPSATFTEGGINYVVAEFVNATDYLANLSYTTSIATPAAFTAMTSALWLRYMDHMLHDQNTKLTKKTNILKYLESFCHEEREITLSLVPGYTSYSTWFGTGGINVSAGILSQYTSQPNVAVAWQNLALAIITALVPVDSIMEEFTDVTLSSDDYARLTKLFENLCSYLVVFLQSSPETPTFTLGAKWDTFYGPDAMVSCWNQIDVLEVSSVSTMVCDAQFDLDGGVCLSRIVDAVAKRKHTTTTESIMTGNISTTPFISMTKARSMTSSSMVTGSINLKYNRMHTNMVGLTS